jgi:hypothetical protein
MARAEKSEEAVERKGKDRYSCCTIDAEFIEQYRC